LGNSVKRKKHHTPFYLQQKNLMDSNKRAYLIDLKNRTMEKFFRSTIATKMTVAYMPLATIIIILSLYTLSSLDELGRLSRDIVKGTWPPLKTPRGCPTVF